MDLHLVIYCWRWEKTKGGWIVFIFSSFSLTEVTDQKQIEFSFWSHRFLPQTGSSLVPLALPRRVHYECNIWLQLLKLQLARDFKLLKHNRKRFPMLKHNRKRLLLLKHTSKRLLIKQNYKDVCLSLNTWYTISGVHDTNQIHS